MNEAYWIDGAFVGPRLVRVGFDFESDDRARYEAVRAEVRSRGAGKGSGKPRTDWRPRDGRK